MSNYERVRSDATRFVIFSVMAVTTAAAQAPTVSSDKVLIEDVHFVNGELLITWMTEQAPMDIYF